MAPKLYANFLISMVIYREASGAQLAFMGAEELRGMLGSGDGSKDDSSNHDDFDPIDA